MDWTLSFQWPWILENTALLFELHLSLDSSTTEPLTWRETFCFLERRECFCRSPNCFRLLSLWQTAACVPAAPSRRTSSSSCSRKITTVFEVQEVIMCRFLSMYLIFTSISVKNSFLHFQNQNELQAKPIFKELELLTVLSCHALWSWSHSGPHTFQTAAEKNTH